ncbi:MAG: lytic transglycosylase domain-containing protein [Bdellovibrio sp.]|nr:lytic transglycosylase domain-containing protein [Bdellovibrio sp.]
MERKQRYLDSWSIKRGSSLFAFLGLIVCFAAGAGTKREQSLRLSDLVSDPKTSGYLQESAEVRLETESQIEEFRPLFEDTLSETQSAALKKNCDTPGWKDSHPLCRLLPYYLRRQRASKNQRRMALRVPKGDAEAAFKSSNDTYFFTHLGSVKWLYAKLRETGQLDVAVGRYLTRSSCPPSSFLLTLGLQLETDLPDPGIQKFISKIYSKAMACGQDLASLQASYRLGLLRIFENKCDEAEEILSKIPDTPQAPDYRVRIGYWRYYCGVQTKNTALADRLRAWLLREYPLSLHTLLAYSDRSLEKDLPFQKRVDPEIHLRSEVDRKLARFTRLVEGLLTKGLTKPASLLLETQITRVQLTEPEFQLYWLVLLKRAGNYPASFSLLASTFRAHPELIARDTLSLMYPFEYFPLVDELRQSFDPYLIISLIRQESAFDASAKSAAGARGLMQIQPSTAHHIERVGAQQLFNPRTNIRLGVKYLTHLTREFSDEKELSLAAYNAGPTKIKYWRQRFPTENRLLFLDLLPLRETRDYVTSIARNYFWYRKLYAPGTKPGPENAFYSLSALWGPTERGEDSNLTLPKDRTPSNLSDLPRTE